jgi:hypothetical protein
MKLKAKCTCIPSTRWRQLRLKYLQMAEGGERFKASKR